MQHVQAQGLLKSELGTCAAINPYQHRALQDPLTYIRLLKGTPTHGRSTLLSFTLETWPIEHAPKYNAISYTWGEMAVASILVDGCSMLVRTNCRHALRQALAYDPDGYVWVDSICINQEDIQEKSHQVHRMHAIHKRAWRVLACIGDHRGQSELICKAAYLIRRLDFLTPLIEDDLEILLDEMSRSGIDLRHFNTFWDLRTALTACGRRQYWTRIWIFQEMVAGGAQSVRVLCGVDTVSWEALCTLLDVMRMIAAGDQELHSSPVTVLAELERDCHRAGGEVRLDDLLSWLDFTTCSDPRDSVYALLALIDWHTSELELVSPDYARTAYILALQLLPTLRPYAWRRVMRMLRVDASIEMQMLSQERANPRSMTKGISKGHQVTFERVLIARLWAQKNVGLCMATRHVQAQEVWTNPIAATQPGRLETPHNRGMNGSFNSGVFEMLAVFAGHQTAALVCSQCRPGNLLVFLPSLSVTSCLIIRSTGESMLDVVGLGYAFEKTAATIRHTMRAVAVMDTYRLPKDDIFRADLQLRASAEDITAICHRLLADNDTGHEVDVAVARVVMRPIEVSNGAASLLPCDDLRSQHGELHSGRRASC